MKLARSRAALISVALVLGAAMPYYYLGLLIPLRKKEFRLANAEPGNWSDLYPRWLGARELLLHGRNPYSREVTRDIQRGFYGRPLDPTNPRDPADQEAFAYPLYVVFLLAPSLSSSFPVVSTAFGIVLFILTLTSIFLWIYALRLRLTTSSLLLAIIAAMTSYPVLDGLQLQQLTLLVAALLAAALAALAGNRLFVAGVLLALATIKPQLVIVLALGLVLWSFAGWRERKPFILGFGLGLLVLFGSAEVVLPGWFGMWRQAGASYLAYVRPSLLDSVLGATVGLLVGTAAVLGAVALFWLFRRYAPGSDHFNVSIATTLLVTTLVVPNAGSAKYNLVLLIPAILWLFSFASDLGPTSKLGGLGWLLAVNGLVWQWLLAFVVVVYVVLLRHPLQREATLRAAAPEILVFYFPILLLPSLVSALIHLQHAQPEYAGQSRTSIRHLLSVTSAQGGGAMRNTAKKFAARIAWKLKRL